MELDPSPMAILFVKGGSRGDKLLYKYPYCTEEDNEYETERDTLLELNNNSQEYCSESSGRMNPYAHPDVDSDPFASVEPTASYIDKNGHLTGFTDKALSNLLAVKTEMCRSRFELQINEVRFIGHPTLMDPSEKTSLKMFHLVFVLNADLAPEIVNGYYSLCKRLSVGLKYMEHIKRYLSVQVNSMLEWHEKATHHEISDEAAIDPYDQIVRHNDLARELTGLFNKLCSKGEAVMNLDNWFNAGFVMPHKVYANLPIGKYYNLNNQCSRRGRLLRYMSVLLLKERPQFQASQFPLVTPTIKRVLDVTSPTSTLYKIAQDADVIYSHLVHIVDHFVHWGMMMVIYPICNENLYVMSSKAIEIMRQHDLCKTYRERFPFNSYSLSDLLELFRTPLTPHELIDANNAGHNAKYESFFTILWLLECGLITQIHKYVYITLPMRVSGKNHKEKKKLRRTHGVLPGTKSPNLNANGAFSDGFYDDGSGNHVDFCRRESNQKQVNLCRNLNDVFDNLSDQSKKLISNIERSPNNSDQRSNDYDTNERGNKNLLGSDNKSNREDSLESNSSISGDSRDYSNSKNDSKLRNLNRSRRIGHANLATGINNSVINRNDYDVSGINNIDTCDNINKSTNESYTEKDFVSEECDSEKLGTCSQKMNDQTVPKVKSEDDKNNEKLLTYEYTEDKNKYTTNIETEKKTTEAEVSVHIADKDSILSFKDNADGRSSETDRSRLIVEGNAGKIEEDSRMGLKGNVCREEINKKTDSDSKTNSQELVKETSELDSRPIETDEDGNSRDAGGPFLRGMLRRKSTDESDDEDFNKRKKKSVSWWMARSEKLSEEPLSLPNSPSLNTEPEFSARPAADGGRSTHDYDVLFAPLQQLKQHIMQKQQLSQQQLLYLQQKQQQTSTVDVGERGDSSNEPSQCNIKHVSPSKRKAHLRRSKSSDEDTAATWRLPKATVSDRRSFSSDRKNNRGSKKPLTDDEARLQRGESVSNKGQTFSSPGSSRKRINSTGSYRSGGPTVAGGAFPTKTAGLLASSSPMKVGTGGSTKTTGGAPKNNNEEEEELTQLLLRSNLTAMERVMALDIYAQYHEAIKFDDMKTFIHLSVYLRGEHHIEEIMYSTNLSRARVLSIIDKFSPMLCVVEGPARNYPINID